MKYLTLTDQEDQIKFHHTISCCNEQCYIHSHQHFDSAELHQAISRQVPACNFSFSNTYSNKALFKLLVLQGSLLQMEMVQFLND